MTSLVPLVMQSVRDRTIPVKLAAERALLHILRIQEGSFESYIQDIEPNQRRSINDYAKRVLVKLLDRDSDDE
jgi:hypothetical protein